MQLTITFQFQEQERMFAYNFPILIYPLSILHFYFIFDVNV